MLIRLLCADLKKKKIQNGILFIFVFLAAYLLAVSINMIAELSGSINGFFAKAQVPHYVQMTEGLVDSAAIASWSNKQKLVKKRQIVEMLLLDNANVYFGKTNTSESNSVMNIDLVTQNHSFDYLLSLKNKIIHLAKAEIAVPIYFMQHNHLNIGDIVTLDTGHEKLKFTIVDFLRDAQMNPAIIHSKRFLINAADYNHLKKNNVRKVTLIEFRLTDSSAIQKFSSHYQMANLPKNGPSINYNLFKVLNAVTDGMTISIIILLSVLLTIIAILCLRYIALTTIEEDYKQIGILKALGVTPQNIKKLYLAKYITVAGLACVVGYVAFQATKHFFLHNILLYFGATEAGILTQLIPFLGIGMVISVISLSCLIILRRFDKISAVDALRENVIVRGGKHHFTLSLAKYHKLGPNIYYGLNDICQRWRAYLLLFFVFSLCSFIVILPINFYTTVKSPSFISYMGVGRSDIRIDFRNTNFSTARITKLLEFIKRDPDVAKFAFTTTRRYQFKNDKGGTDPFNVDTGDIAIFSIKYLQGRSPVANHEIAISYLNHKELKKNIGDTLTLQNGNSAETKIITGIYQDITNGGKTAKATFQDNGDPLWSVINIDFKPGVLIAKKVVEYNGMFSPARITYLNEYLDQTLGDLIMQLEQISMLTMIVALTLSVLITSLFLKLLLANHHSQIAIMKALGFNKNNIRVQYITRSLLVSNLGMLSGAILSATLGQHLISFMWSFMGASEIQLIIDPMLIYVVCPVVLILVVTLTTLANTISIQDATVAKLNAE